MHLERHKWCAAACAVLLLVSATELMAQPDDVATLNAQVDQLFKSGEYAKAVPFAQQALALAEKRYGRQHSNVTVGLNNLALLLQETDRLAEAEVSAATGP